MKLLQLTKKGDNLISELIPIIEKVDNDFFLALNDKNKRAMMHCLQALKVNTNSLGKT